jgi:hypothetical protein
VGLLEFSIVISPPTSFLIGDVWWLDRASAFRENLAYVDQHNRVIIKVDNVTDIPFNEKRNSVIVILTASVRSKCTVKCYIRFESRRKTGTRLVASGL